MALYQRRSPVDPHLYPPHKRRKHHRGSHEPPERTFGDESFHHDDLTFPVDDILANHGLFTLNNIVGQHGSPVVTTAPTVTTWNPVPTVTGTHELDFVDNALQAPHHGVGHHMASPFEPQSPIPLHMHSWLRNVSTLEPMLPNRNTRMVYAHHGNPFRDNATNRIPHLKPPIAPEDGEVNGYLKFKLGKSDIQSDEEPVSPIRGPYKPLVNEHGTSLSQLQTPRDFGLGCKLDNVDRILFQFYRIAWCRGRTILPSTNCWLVDLGPMLPGNECLRHTLLSLACTYVLDYQPTESLRRRANHHYERAVKLLSDALDDPAEQAIGKGDALVGAITLFNMHDVVTWEARRDKTLVPRWLEGARLASNILDSTDPGYRYYKPGNVQATNARISNTVIVGRAAILVLTVLPLNIENTRQKFNWLLHGSERASRKIHGGCGLSPKLLHHFSQITHIAASLAQDPEGPMIGMYAEKLEQRLQNLRQWSELSRGYRSVQSLFDALILNEQGVVDTAAHMTDLTAEGWRVAAQIYLQCRLLRLPRTHPKVVEHVNLLAEIIRRMPCAGPLFTAQAPFLPVFLLGLVSTLAEHRDVARNWFETVITASTCRSSVPPAWQALQRLQDWADVHITPTDDPDIDRRPYGERQPWWEWLVSHIMDTEGTLCLI